MFSVLATLLLASADPLPTASALAAAATPTPAAAAKPAGKAKSDTVCWQETPTGSHFPKTICMPKEQLDAEQRDAQQSIAHFGRAGGGKVGPQ